MIIGLALRKPVVGAVMYFPYWKTYQYKTYIHHLSVSTLKLVSFFLLQRLLFVHTLFSYDKL